MMYVLPTSDNSSTKLYETYKAILWLSGMTINHGATNPGLGKEVFAKNVSFVRLEFFVVFIP